MPSVSTDLNVNADKKSVKWVNSTEVMTQSSSKSRGGRMDLKPGNAYPNDQYC